MTRRTPGSLFRESLLAAACATALLAAAQAARAESGAQPVADAAGHRAATTQASTPALSAAAVGKLPLDAQVAWLQRAAQHGELETLDDAQLIALFSSLDPRTLPRYIAAGPNG
ncbi:MAG TPA: DUF1571 domain-containing protein, partial [Paraburkholderia sp.]